MNCEVGFKQRKVIRNVQMFLFLVLNFIESNVTKNGNRQKNMGERQSPKSRCKLHFDWLLISSEGCFVWFLFWVNELNQSHWSCGSKLSVLCFCLSGDQRDSIRTSLTLSRGQSSVRAEGFTTILSHAKISAPINKTEELFLQSAAHFARITLFINIEGGLQPPLDHVQIHVII